MFKINYYNSNNYFVKKIIDFIFYKNIFGLQKIIRSRVWDGESAEFWNKIPKLNNNKLPQQRKKAYYFLEKKIINKDKHLVYEIGVGNGQIQHLMSTKFSNVKFTGFDINNSTIEFNNKYYKRTNSSFKILNTNWIKDLDAILPEKNLVILFHSTLAYLFPIELQNLADKLKNKKNFIILITDTIKKKNKNKLYRGNLAYNHNYLSIFKNFKNIFLNEEISIKEKNNTFLSYVFITK